MAIRADAIVAYINERTTAIMQSPAVATARDAAPLPVFDRNQIRVFGDPVLNQQRVRLVSSAFRQQGVSRLGCNISGVRETGTKRVQVTVNLVHFDLRDRHVGRSELVYYLDFRNPGPRLVMLEIVDCPAWSRVWYGIGGALAPAN